VPRSPVLVLSQYVDEQHRRVLAVLTYLRG
jgi:hypothetical protein